MSTTDAFPELDRERDRLAFARACRDEMIERFATVDPNASADEITKEYVELTVAEALDDLRTPGAGDFFGRIEEGPDRWYIGRRHIEDRAHDPVVVDWRAPIAAPFYRATGIDPLGLTHRRRFTMADGDITAYLDEQLDDPDAAHAATGVPDPVLAEIGAARTGEMREIVATIQAEQDVVIRSSVDQCLVVQGGPGTGKTAVGLHRAAYLLFEHRRRLVRDGVLVVGPNAVFLDYIGNVLPSLGERSVQQRTVLDLCIPRLPTLAGTDDVEARRVKGSPEMLAALEAASTAHVTVPTEAVRQPFGARTLVFEADEISEWIRLALDANQPVNKRRASLKPIIDRVLLQRTGKDGAYSKMDVLRSVLQRCWPAMQPVKLVDRVLMAQGFGPGGSKRRWTAADQLLVDEANTMLDGTPFTFGHVVVDEAQDHSAVALRVIGRRSPSGSMTILGDLAQSTTPAGQTDWDTALGHLACGRDATGTVAHLTIGYRVPGPILDVANRLLPLTGVSTAASTSVRVDGEPPAVRVATDLRAAVAESVRAMRHRHPNTGVVAPDHLADLVAEALAAAGLTAVQRTQHLAHGEVPVFGPEAVKGLEFDGVVIVNAHEILDGTARGARLLYVSLTRAVQVVELVGDSHPPAVLGLRA
ncbi:MAG: hypothetical protein WD023_03600 [Ilumatobacteraceae bacterium]